MKREFSISAEFPVAPERVYRAWLSSKEHAAMTGSPAKVQPRVGGAFTAWDGYITGKTLELVPNVRIVQAWRTSEFSEGDPDSRVELSFEAIDGRTRLTLTHSAIPEGQVESYRAGWEEWYFRPMQDYFST